MRSIQDQELFKALSNRTRTKPQQIYSKITNHIQLLQQQIVHFNQTEQEVPMWLKEETNKMGGAPKRHALKLMTQPKYQNLLINCQLPQGEKGNIKTSKLMRKGTMKNNSKSPTNHSFLSTSKSFNPSFGGRPRLLNSSKFTKYVKQSYYPQNSTMIKTVSKLPVDSIIPNLMKRSIDVKKKDLKISMTESVLLSVVEQTTRQVQKHKTKSTFTIAHTMPLTLRQQIEKKHKILQQEWDKTERYHNRIGNWIGSEDMDKIQHTKLFNSRANQVIDKIKRSRPTTSQGSHCDLKQRKNRIYSEQS